MIIDQDTSDAAHQHGHTAVTNLVLEVERHTARFGLPGEARERLIGQVLLDLAAGLQRAAAERLGADVRISMEVH